LSPVCSSQDTSPASPFSRFFRRRVGGIPERFLPDGNLIQKIKKEKNNGKRIAKKSGRLFGEDQAEKWAFRRAT
jgi:hypothetical protein